MALWRNALKFAIASTGDINVSVVNSSQMLRRFYDLSNTVYLKNDGPLIAYLIQLKLSIS